jgi:hypothetical protein
MMMFGSHRRGSQRVIIRDLVIYVCHITFMLWVFVAVLPGVATRDGKWLSRAA